MCLDIYQHAARSNPHLIILIMFSSRGVRGGCPRFSVGTGFLGFLLAPDVLVLSPPSLSQRPIYFGYFWTWTRGKRGEGERNRIFDMEFRFARMAHLQRSRLVRDSYPALTRWAGFFRASRARDKNQSEGWPLQKRRQDGGV